MDSNLHLFEIDGQIIECAEVALDVILPLRHDVIITGTNRSSDEFDGDRLDTTHHYAARLNDEVIGCLTMLLTKWNEADAWQLRGMATRSDWKGRGVGKHLLDFAVSDLNSRFSITQYWCNARTNALEFYKKQGWQTESQEFVIEGVGSHYKMSKVSKINIG